MTKPYETKYFDCVSSEFSSAELGDTRLTQRLMEMAAALAEKPEQSFPKSLGRGAGIEGGYRLLRNQKISFQSIVAAHIEQTRLRAELERDVLVLHDTTEFKFSSKREGLGYLSGSRSAGDGFYGHFCMAVSQQLSRPLGIIAAEATIKKKKKGYQSPAKKRVDPTRKTLCCNPCDACGDYWICQGSVYDNPSCASPPTSGCADQTAASCICSGCPYVELSGPTCWDELQSHDPTHLACRFP